MLGAHGQRLRSLGHLPHLSSLGFCGLCCFPGGLTPACLILTYLLSSGAQKGPGPPTRKILAMGRRQTSEPSEPLRACKQGLAFRLPSGIYMSVGPQWKSQVYEQGYYLHRGHQGRAGVGPHGY